MNTAPQKTKLVIIGAFLLVVAWIGLTIWQQLTFHVVSTNPATGKVSTISPFFKITFSQPVAKDSLQLQTSPGSFTNTPSVDGNIVTLPLKTPLSAGTTYTITITNIESTKGKKISGRTFTLKPTYIASSDLPEDQRKALLQREDIGGTANTTDPILVRLPHQTTDYILEQDTAPQKNPPKNLALIATLTLSQSDMTNQDAAVARYKQEVSDYITSLALDPSKYSITYVVQTP